MTPQHESNATAAATSTNAINCCTSAASSEISIDTSSIGDEQSKLNNNILDKYANVETNFRKCKPIDIVFENVKYTVRNFSFSQRKFGKYPIVDYQKSY